MAFLELLQAVGAVIAALGAMTIGSALLQTLLPDPDNGFQVFLALLLRAGVLVGGLYVGWWLLP